MPSTLMPCLLPYLNAPSRTLLLVLASSLAVASCGPGTPEDAGKKLADWKCETDNKQDERRYEMDKTLVEEIKSKEITNLEQFKRREHELRKATRTADSTDEAEGKKIFSQIELDFPKEDDRHTIANVVQARTRQCNEERKERTKSREDMPVYKYTQPFYDHQ